MAAAKPHTIMLGRLQTVKATSDTGQTAEIKVRPLLVDTKIKEYTTGAAHDVSERLFVVQRVFRLNDALPQEEGKPRWTWQLGGWISADRTTGRVAQLNLAVFDPETSRASWYRDFAAYCGLSDDGSKSYMVVSQLGRRKPILKKEFAGSGCPAPLWERAPSRVTFVPGGAEKATFVVHGHAADLQPVGDEEQP